MSEKRTFGYKRLVRILSFLAVWSESSFYIILTPLNPTL